MVALTFGYDHTRRPWRDTSDTAANHLDQDGLTDTPILTDLVRGKQILAT